MDEQQLLLFLSRIKKDPIYFVRKVIGVEPTEQQKKILAAIAPPGAKVSVRSGHGIGKSAVLSWVTLWFLLCYGEKGEKTRIPCTAPSSHQLFDVLWPEINTWREMMHPSFNQHIDSSSDRIWLSTNRDARYAVARTARKENPEALQGFHAKHLLFLIDEASGVNEAIFETAEGALSTPGARILMTSNPTRTDGYFYRSHTVDRDHWTPLAFSCLDSPLVSPDYVESMAKRYGKDSSVYKVRVLGEFPLTSADTVIPLNLIEDAIGRDVVYKDSEAIAGLDVARFGDDATSVVIRRGKEIFYADQWRNKDLMETCGKIMHLYKEKSMFNKIYVDSIGLGAGVVDRLEELGIPVIGVNVGETAAYKEKYNRYRDELWFESREFFENKRCSIKEDMAYKDQLIAELSIITYKFTSNGKLKVEGKDDLKKRLGKDGASPNLADAFNLTLCKGGKYQQRRKAVQIQIANARGWT